MIRLKKKWVNMTKYSQNPLAISLHLYQICPLEITESNSTHSASNHLILSGKFTFPMSFYITCSASMPSSSTAEFFLIEG